MSIIGSNVLAGASGQAGYNLNNSLRYRSSASAYLSRTPTVAGSRTTWTWSGWVKRGAISATSSIFSAGSGANITELFFTAANILRFYDYISSSYATNLETTQVFRDPSAWYHITVVYDTTQATAANRVRLYVNGNQVTSFSSTTYPAQNYASGIMNSTTASAIGGNAGTGYFDGYMTEINFVDGQALTPSSFGETSTTTGTWIPKAYSGSYGTNGFKLNFSDTSAATAAAIGKDSSGNGNNWTPNNISVTAGTTYDAMTDVPTNTSATVANYAVMNPLMKFGSNLSWNNGNLQLVKSSSSTQDHTYGTIGASSGKYYWETTITAFAGSSPYIYYGIARGLDTTTIYDNTAIWYASDGTKSNRASASYNQAYGSSYTTNDVLAVALDLDAGTITFYKNNVSQGVAYSNLGSYPGLYMAYINFDGTSVTATTEWNFGQRPFTYTPPTGYVALNTFNLPTPTILQGNKYMDATLWTGAGASTMTITNTAGFKPDMVWVKSRSNAYSNLVWNSIVGVGNTTMLVTDTTAAEGSYYGNANLTSFNSNGFSTGATSGTNVLNANGVTNVAWQWQAGQGSTSSNTSGTITSTVSVNTTAGFSVVTYTGTGVAGNKTIGHGLGVAPSMIILKDRDTASSGGPGALGANDWFVWHSSFANVNSILGLNSTVATQTTSGFWGASVPSSTVFGINGTLASLNESGDRYLAYCWAAISGFSAFGSYTGNGSADGPFVFTNFQPKYVMIKISSGIESWYVYDSVRNTYNLTNTVLSPNDSAAEYTASASVLDLLSNGFKIRGAAGGLNVSSATYIYACFASNPFKNSNAR